MNRQGSTAAPGTMPAMFIGHGSPMNTLERNRYTEAWRRLGASLPTPRAVLCISAHWYTNATAVTAMERPRTIHDFYGFPDELFAFDYPAPGDPEIADLVVDTVEPQWVGLDVDSWGLDHGTWSVLAHLFPDADVPVLQLSINALKPLDDHVDIGARLAPLRAQGVLVVGSGNIVHNLGRIDPSRPNQGFDWARRFDEAAQEVLRQRPGDVLELVDHPDFDLAVPTPDHFIPVLHIAGLAAASSTAPDVIVEGCALGSLSMTSYGVGIDGGPVDTATGTSSPQHESVAPPDDANI